MPHAGTFTCQLAARSAARRRRGDLATPFTTRRLVMHDIYARAKWPAYALWAAFEKPLGGYLRQQRRQRYRLRYAKAPIRWLTFAYAHLSFALPPHCQRLRSCRCRLISACDTFDMAIFDTLAVYSPPRFCQISGGSFIAGAITPPDA